MELRTVRYGIEDVQTVLATQKVQPSQMGFDLPQDYYEHVSGAQTLSVSSSDEDAYVLCFRAAQKLIELHPNLVESLDAVVVSTLPTKPMVVPVSTRLQGSLGLKKNAFCLDLSLSCPGFLQASSLILDMIAARGWKKVLLITADTLTKIIRPDDHSMRLLMSDSATAILFSDRPRFVFDQFEFFANGNLASILEERDHHVFMDGPKVYETVLHLIPQSVRNSLERMGLAQQDVDLFLFHQGSRRLLDRLIENLELDPARVPRAIEQVGNLGSSSIPQLLDGLLRDPKACTRRIFATAFGAGFHWAHASLQQKG